MELKLDKAIEIFDLILKMNWSAIPLWFAISLPIIYIAFRKTLPETQPTTAIENSFLPRLKNWFTMPKVDSCIIFLSLLMFIVGTVTLKLDQYYKEKTRNNGLRMKQYFVLKNNYQVSRSSLITGNVKIHGLDSYKINKVLELYPNEFIEVDNNTIVMVDSATKSKVIQVSEKLLDKYLDNYLSYSVTKSNVSIQYSLLKNASNFFTLEVINKLVVDSSLKYRYTSINNNDASIVIIGKVNTQ